MLTRKRFQKGQVVSASDQNRLASEVERTARIYTEFPLESYNTGGGVGLRWVNRDLWAVITSGSSSSSASSGASCRGVPLSWKEIDWLGDGTYRIKPGGRQGGPGQNPAYQTNGICLDPDTVVWLRPGLQHEFLAEVCCQPANPPTSSSSSSSSISSSSSSQSSSSQSSSSQSSSSVSQSSSSASCTSTVGNLCIPLYRYRCNGGQLEEYIDGYLYIPASAGAALYSCACPS